MAASEVFANQASTTVTSGGTDAPSSGTVETWTVTSSASFPSASSEVTQFHVCDTAESASSEIIAVTSVSGTTWTVTRGAESTTPVTHTSGFTIQQVMTAGFLGGLVPGFLAPSGDTTGATDVANINSLLAAGQNVVLAGYTYYINAPIAMQNGVTLSGLALPAGNPVADYGYGSLPITGTVIKGVSGFSGTQMIGQDTTTSQGGGWNITGIALDGSSIGGSTVSGITLEGYIADILIRDVVIWKAPLHGIYFQGVSGANPDQVNCDHVAVHGSGSIGMNIDTGVSDSSFYNCWISASVSHNWQIVNGNDTRWVNCRGEGSTGSGYGFYINCTSTYTGGTMTFVACETTSNKEGGWYVAGGESGGTSTVALIGCRAGDTTPWTYSGNLAVQSDAAYNTSTSAPTFLS